MPVDVISLWNFRDPAESEARFRAAQEGASRDDRIVLETQIARSFGIRKEFEKAREILDNIDIQDAGPEAQVRTWLERGRSLCSTTHPPETQTPEAKQEARTCYTTAFELAKQNQLDYLAVDCLHMMAMVDTAPEDQLAWDLKAIAYMEASPQEEAKKWEGSLYNNTGYALAEMGRHDEAHEMLSKALECRERQGGKPNILVAHWMIAWNERLRGNLGDALGTQLRLEREWDELGEPDGYVYQELGHIYAAMGDRGQAEYYQNRAKELLGA